MQKGNRSEKRLVAKFTSVNAPEDSTDFYIGTLEKEKIKKLVEFLEEINLKPSLYCGSSENETVVSVDISSERKFKAYERILLFMKSLEEMKEANISSVISRSNSLLKKSCDIETVYTLANSSDISDIAKRLSAGEQSDIELIVSKPYDKRALFQKSKNIINYIQRSENSLESNISIRRKTTSKFFKKAKSVKTLFTQKGISATNKKYIMTNLYKRLKHSKFFSGLFDVCSLKAVRKGLRRRDTINISRDRSYYHSVSRVKGISHRRFKENRNVVVNNKRNDGILTLEAYTQTGAAEKRGMSKSIHGEIKRNSSILRRRSNKYSHSSTSTNALSYSCYTKVQSTSRTKCTCSLTDAFDVCPKVCFINNLNDYNIGKVQDGHLVYYPINIVPPQTCYREQYRHIDPNVIKRISNREVRESTTIFSFRNSHGTINTSFLTKKKNLIDKKWVRVKRRKTTSNCNRNNKSNSEKVIGERKSSELTSNEYLSSYLLRKIVDRQEPNPNRLLEDNFYKEQLLLLNEKIDNITGLQKQLVDASTGCFSNPFFQNVITERIDVGVTCASKKDVSIECAEKEANAQMEYKIIENELVNKGKVVTRPRRPNRAYSVDAFPLRSENIKFPLYSFPSPKAGNVSSPHFKCSYRSRVFSNYASVNWDSKEAESGGLFVKSIAILKKLKTIFRIGVGDNTKERRDLEELMYLRSLLRKRKSCRSFDNEETDDENFRFWLSRSNTGGKSLTCKVGGRKELYKQTEKKFQLKNITGASSRGIRSNHSPESEDTDEEDFQFWVSKSNTGKKVVSFRKPLID